MSVLATNSGCNLAYCSLRNLGYTISQWDSVEYDPACRSVTDRIIPPDQLRHLAPHDSTKISASIATNWYDLHISTAPCTPWSRLQDNPRGFDDPRSAPFVADAATFKQVQATNPRALCLIENVIPHTALADDVSKMNQLWGVEFSPINASAWGSPSSRPRSLATNFVDLSTIPTVPKQSLQPSLLVQGEFYCHRPVMACIVSSSCTKNPPTVYCDTFHDNAKRRLNISEMENFQGWPRFITNGGVEDPIGLDDVTRQRMIGNATNNAHMTAIFKHLGSAIRHPPVCCLPTRTDDMTTDQMEVYLGDLSTEQLTAFFEHRLDGYSLPPLHLELQPSCTLPARPPTFPIAAGLKPSAEYHLQDQIAKGYMREVPFSTEFFITSGFFKSKNRTVTCPRTGAVHQALRALGNFPPLNSCTKPLHHHIRFQIPDQRGLSLRVPLGSTHFSIVDISDAYHTCPLTAAAQKLVVVDFGGKLYQYIGGAQGIAQMAIWWTAHLEDGFYTALGRHWLLWWVGYVDDFGIHGKNADQHRRRHHILTTLLTVLKKPFDTKDKAAGCQSNMVLAGLYFDEFGVRVEDLAVETLQYTLEKYEVKTLVDAQHVLGVVQYSMSAFDFSNDSWKEFSSLLAVVENCIVNHLRSRPQTKKIAWGAAERDACISLSKMINNLPWAYMRPEDLLSPESCLISLTDASDDAVCNSLFLVQKSDARDVLPEDLKNPKVSRLIAVKRKKLSDGQRRWHTCEAELYGMGPLTCKYFGSFITAATANYPPGGVSKIGLWSDATTAISQWSSLHVPEGMTDHLSAKARRFNNWADKTAGTIYWNADLKHLPGDQISLPHMMTHISDLLKDRQAELQAVGMEVIAAPMHVHSFHEIPANSKGLKSKTGLASPPHGFKVAFLALSGDECSVVAASLLADDTLYMRVPLSSIYKMAAGIATDTVSKLERDIIKSWLGIRFFAFAPPGATVPLLFTPSTLQLVLPDDSEDGSWNDPTKTLVMVVPKGAMVRVTDSDRQPMVIETNDHGTHGDFMCHDLRKDIVYLCHNNANHPSFSRTLQAVRSMVWFPGYIAYVRYHIDACSNCMSRMKTQRAVGCSVTDHKRLNTIVIDHYKLKDDLPSLSGITFILTMTDLCTGFTIFVVVPSDKATDTAIAIHNSWIPFLGFFSNGKSDRGPGFASSCMEAFRKVIGVKKWEFSAANNATQHAVVEHKHEVLHHVLSVANIKGDINSVDDLKFYVAEAMSRQNHHSGSHGFSPFELLTGQPPRTVMDMALVPASDIPDLQQPLDAAFVEKVRLATAEAVATHHELRAEQARRNCLSADVTLRAAKSRTVDIRPGEEVSYNGKVFTVEEVISHGPAGASKAVIRDDDGNRDTVNADAITGLAEPSSELMIPQSHDFLPQDFVFIPHGDGISGAIVTAVAPDKITAQLMEPAPKQKAKYAKVWVSDSGERVRKNKAPAGSSPDLVTVHPHDVVIKGYISPKGVIGQSLIDYLSSTGVICSPVIIDTRVAMEAVRDRRIDMQDLQIINESPVLPPWFSRLIPFWWSASWPWLIAYLSVWSTLGAWLQSPGCSVFRWWHLAANVSTTVLIILGPLVLQGLHMPSVWDSVATFFHDLCDRSFTTAPPPYEDRDRYL